MRKHANVLRHYLGHLFHRVMDAQNAAGSSSDPSASLCDDELDAVVRAVIDSASSTELEMFIIIFRCGTAAPDQCIDSGIVA